MRKLMLMILLFIPLVHAQEWMYQDSALMQTEMSSEVDLIGTGPGASTSYVEVSYRLFPRSDERQEAYGQKNLPEAIKQPDTLVFRVDNPSLGTLNFRTESKVRTSNSWTKVTSKVAFPITEPHPATEYLLPTDNINSDDPAINSIASSIVAGNNDLFMAVSKIAAWVDSNIQYSLDTLTEKGSQSASWTLEQRYGVCDEITTLFIALLRSVGIPARYVSGQAYTDYNDLNDWGSHAWAEVYFPGFGWVQYDIAYHQFGRIDNSHIKLRVSADSNESSVNYAWKGTNVGLEYSSLMFKTTLLERGDPVTQPITITAEPIKASTGFGSYNLIEATVKNNEDYYQSWSLTFTSTEDITVIGDTKKFVSIKPNGERKLYWMIKVRDNLDEDYSYTFPVVISTSQDISGRTEFRSVDSGARYSEANMLNILETLDTGDELAYAKDMQLSCELVKDTIYLHEPAEVTCTLKNTGNSILENIKTCQKSCEQLSLGIGQEESLKYEVQYTEEGSKEIIVFASHGDLTVTRKLHVAVEDRPYAEVSDVACPESVGFKDDFNFNFTIQKRSVSIPLNVSIRYGYGITTKGWDFNYLDSDKKFTVGMEGKALGIGENEIKVKLTYLDNNGQSHADEKSCIVRLEDLAWFEKILSWLNSAAAYLVQRFNR